MKTTRRHLLTAAAAWPLAGAAKAQVNEPPIRFLVGFAPGGGTDLMAHLMAGKLQAELNRPVIVQSMPGAGGLIAANALVAAPPNGLTYMVANNAVHTFQTLVFGPELKWDYKRDFAPVAQLSSFSMGLAVADSLNVNNVPEYIAWVRDHPGQAAFGTTGLGGQAHFSGIQLAREAGIQLTPVPYKGATPMVTDLVGGTLPAGISLMDDMLKFHRAGKVRVIGMFGRQRSLVAPDIPTFVEQGYQNLHSESWQGIWAPAKTPSSDIERMQNAIRKVLEMPEVRKSMIEDLYVVPTFRAGAEVAKMQDEEIRLWGPIIKASGFKATS